jgi:hypothetical protein
VRVGETDHHVSVRRGPEGPEVWVCTGACGPLKMRIDDLLPDVSPGSRARNQLKTLRRDANVLEARIARGELPTQALQDAAVQKLTARLEEIGRRFPEVGGLLDLPPGAPRPQPAVREPGPDVPAPPPLRSGGVSDPRVIEALPPGHVRTPDENARARQYFENNEQRAISWWEQRTGRTWPRDPETGEWAIAGHPRALGDGGHPLFVEPEFGDPNRVHGRVPEGGELTDAQRFGARRGNPTQPVQRITDPRVIGELPPGQVRTPDEVARARSYYNNHREEAIRRWEARTGRLWPTNPRTGRPAEGNHTPRALADGAHPLDGIEPELRPSTVPHRTRPEGGGETDVERLGRRRRTTTTPRDREEPEE